VKPRLCIFGDSHYACIRQAERLGLVDTAGIEVEHWGHVGTLFRDLRPGHGIVRAANDRTARRFARLNERGRLALAAEDFDMILVMGARMYVVPLFTALLNQKRAGHFASDSLRVRIARDQMRRQLGYRLARGLAAGGGARILLAPTSFPTEAQDDAKRASAAACDGEDRAALWDLAIRAARQDAVELLPQPEETVADGLLTRAAFAVDGHVEKRDYAHRNPAYGALILARALTVLRAAP
jgi:hypothetical protein